MPVSLREDTVYTTVGFRVVYCDATTNENIDGAWKWYGDTLTQRSYIVNVDLFVGENDITTILSEINHRQRDYGCQ